MRKLTVLFFKICFCFGVFYLVFPPMGWGAPPVADETLALGTALNTFQGGDFDNAIIQLTDFIGKFPDSLKRDQACFFLGEAHFKRSHLLEAKESYQQIVDHFQGSSYYPQAFSQVAYISFDLGQWDQAQSLFKELSEETTDPQKQNEIYDKLYEISVRKEEWVKGIGILLEKLRILANSAEQQGVRNKILSVIQEKLGKKDLEILIDQYPRGFPGDDAYLQLISIYDAEKDTFHLERTIKHFLEIFPKRENIDLLKQKLNAISEKAKKHKTIIGVLVPSLKKAEEITDQVINGVNLALWEYQKTTNDDSIGLVFKELGNQPGKNAADIEAWIKEYSPKAAIGPLLSKEFESLSGLADTFSLPFITPTATHSGITMRSKFLFRNALTNAVQAKEIADYAITQGGLKRFVIFYPNNSYGEELSRVFSAEATRLGGEIIAVETYSPDTSDFSLQIKHLIKTDLSKYGIEGDKTDGKEFKNQIKREYTPGFDAVFLPGEGTKAGLIPSQMAFFDVTGVTFLGANGWNSSDFLKAGGKYLEGGIFVDGFFNESPSPVVSRFVQKYQKYFQSEPTIFSAQSYDAMELILQALKNGATTGNQVRNSLLGITGFEGVSGINRFSPDGEGEKKPFILQIKNGRLQQIN
ncbi:MAG: penicillin-binding protein activator [Nitrospirae bacterium]|nr:penicillin-binding protein activator [Nitrospirota bacterium]